MKHELQLIYLKIFYTYKPTCTRGGMSFLRLDCALKKTVQQKTVINHEKQKH